MTVEELSNAFDTLVSSYRRFKDFDKQELLDSIEFDEYEKSLYLTMAQDEIFVSLYSGKNVYGDSFELTEEMRRSLDDLVKTAIYSTEEDAVEDKPALSADSVFFPKPDNLAFIVQESITFEDDELGCYDGSVANVYPATHDEYNRIRRNPFRGPTKYKALRLDPGDGNVEIISKYKFSTYEMRYLENPEPIVLEDLPNGLTIKGVGTAQTCRLNELVQQPILKRAVQMALASKGI